MEFGKFSARDLSIKLENISESEMLAYNKKRMKKYRYYYIGAMILGILSVTFVIIGGTMLIWGTSAAIMGILTLSLGTYQRAQWKKVFENLLYLKRKRMKNVEELDKSKKKSHKF